MIFSKFFKAKWLHKDSNVRIAAINELLDPVNKEHADILVELIASDSNELVRRAALLRVNTFAQWLDASINNADVKIKEYAYQQVINILANKHTISLSLAEKQDFLAQEPQASLLEAWLQFEQQADLIIALYQKLNKPHLLNQLFIQKAIPEVQLYFIEQTSEISVLEKLLKKAVNNDIAQLITAKVVKLRDLVEKPKKLTKQIQLLLAKLLALKDTRAYDVYLNKQQELTAQWQALQSEFLCLSEDEQANFTLRYDEINVKLQQLFAPKAQEYKELQAKNKLKADQQAAQADFEQVLSTINQALTTAVFENSSLDDNDFANKLSALAEKVSKSVLETSVQQRYLLSIDELQTKLTQLPQIAKSVSEATHLISKISQLALPSVIDELNERQTIFDDWLKQWQKVKRQTNGILPESIKSAHQEIVRTWKDGLKPFQQEQKTLFTQLQKKISDLKRLLASGKYNASFGIFKRVEAGFPHLSEQQKSRIQRDFDNVSKKISELSDWENYIATPRKQQLLVEIQTLIEAPLDNPNKQADKVKQFRKTWNSLGHADESIDKELNDAFNEACEQAFAPCRLFFAEQESLREKNLTVRLALIERAETLANSVDADSLDYKMLDGQLNKLNNTWQEAGEVDRAKYKSLQQDFMKALQPVKNLIRNFHQENITLKTDLIVQAEKELDNEDIFSAIDAVKVLQNQWREIGYAGPRKENKLWQSFRAINDKLFTKRDEIKAEQKVQHSAILQDFEGKLLALTEQLQSSTSHEDLKDLLGKANALLQQALEIKPTLKVVQGIEALIVDIAVGQKQANAVKEQENWSNIFTVLTEIVQSGTTKELLTNLDAYQQLPQNWQKKIASTFNQKSSDDRSLKTLELEIMAGIDSPAELAQQRMQIQVQLMQNKMSSGSGINLSQSFSEWLQVGRLTEADANLIARVRSIFCQ